MERKTWSFALVSGTGGLARAWRVTWVYEDLS